MSHYPTDDTWSEDQPICPNCGHEFSTDDGQYYPQHSSSETFEDEECPDCGIKLNINVEMTARWTIEHPQVCRVKGYHVPYVTEHAHECLYCKQKLTCDCQLHDHCTHDLEPLERGDDHEQA